MAGGRDFDNTNTGTLFVNEDKNADDPKQSKWADRKGGATICCPKCNQTSEFFVSGWVKKVQKQGERFGQAFLSLAFQVKDKQRGMTDRDARDYQRPTRRDDFI